MLLLVLMPVQWYFLLFFYNCTSKVTKKNNTYNKKTLPCRILSLLVPLTFSVYLFMFLRKESREVFSKYGFVQNVFNIETKIWIQKYKKYLFILHNKLCCPFLCISSNRMIVLSISESLHKRVEFAKG